MKQIRVILSLVAVAAITVLFGAITGCEKDASTDTGVDAYFASHPYLSDPRDNPDVPGKTGVFGVTPDTASATKIGQLISLTAVNGVSPFTWDVADSAAGTVTTTDNSRYGVYTVRSLTRNSVIVSDNEGRAAIVSITAGGAGALTITPSTTTLTSSQTNSVASLDGTVIIFQVSGGTPPYGAWSVSQPALGTITAGGVYTVDGSWGSGVNNVTISDSAGAVAGASVTTQVHPLTMLTRR